MRCVICKGNVKGSGNNPDPIQKDGKCCNTCNFLLVIPARMGDIVKCTQCKDWKNLNELMVLAEAELGLGPISDYVLCLTCYEEYTNEED
tara:strand:- start:2311 stop:2580 length:270 start_codon:yes stop_codon:yes gene_type:complete